MHDISLYMNGKKNTIKSLILTIPNQGQDIFGLF